MNIFYTLLLMFSATSLAVEITMLSKEQYKTVYERMIKQTFQDDSQFGRMEGFACPSLLLYSTALQRFVSDEKKFQLLGLAKANSRIPLTKVPALIANRPKNHPFFNKFASAQLLEFLPEADFKKEYIAIYCGKTQQAALSTEGLLAKLINEGATDHNNIHVLNLIQHLDMTLQKQQDWQIFMFRSEE